MRVTVHLASVARDGFVVVSRRARGIPVEAFKFMARDVQASTPSERALQSQAADFMVKLEEEALAELRPSERICVCCKRPIGFLRPGREFDWTTKTCNGATKDGKDFISFSFPSCGHSSVTTPCTTEADFCLQAFEELMWRNSGGPDWQALAKAKISSFPFIYSAISHELDEPVRYEGTPVQLNILRGRSRSSFLDIAQAEAQSASKLALDKLMIKDREQQCVICGDPSTETICNATLLPTHDLEDPYFAHVFFSALAVCDDLDCHKRAHNIAKGIRKGLRECGCGTCKDCGMPKDGPTCVIVCSFGGCRSGANADKRCTRCRTSRYCSTNCQRADWSYHKRICRPESSSGN
ncbi:hypothetical protein DFJ74DRAFT_640400 [Hyaloraphidium curvatum]|nr:hypothetical protein DFJ74DRAFT_640400 [Hyaloraphidium curvatum]